MAIHRRHRTERDIECNLDCPLKDKRILLLGAGGAAQGVLLPLLKGQPRALTLSNRTPEKALHLKAIADRQHVNTPIALDIAPFDQLANRTYDIIINATSAGLGQEGIALPASLFSSNVLAYDMMYGRETAFMASARQQGATVTDGLGMLVEQAAAAFELWRGVRPDTPPVLAVLRAQ
jgi:shikimate dehydrogenase